ncbi:MAG TPA: arsenate reductase ArsC [Thermomicrobiales bacterium]|nr:arsenate reductase ArsC [Thermomicrobiales bacterium]
MTAAHQARVSRTTEASPITVLFLCTHNSARSQMAEALLRHHGGATFEVSSAGTEETRVHPLAIAAMEDIGIDISGQRSKHLNEFIEQDFNYVITVCDGANEACPIFPGDPRRIHWSFPDPSAAQGSDAERQRAFNRVRDEINMRLRTWIQLF